MGFITTLLVIAVFRLLVFNIKVTPLQKHTPPFHWPLIVPREWNTLYTILGIVIALVVPYVCLVILIIGIIGVLTKKHLQFDFSQDPITSWFNKLK